MKPITAYSEKIIPFLQKKFLLRESRVQQEAISSHKVALMLLQRDDFLALLTLLTSDLQADRMEVFLEILLKEAGNVNP